MDHNIIQEKFRRAKEVNASTHDLASSLAIVIWREVNNWQESPHRTDGDFIKFHAGCKRCQDEITIMSRGIQLILEAERERCARIAFDAGYGLSEEKDELWHNSFTEREIGYDVTETIAAAIRAGDSDETHSHKEKEEL